MLRMFRHLRSKLSGGSSPVGTQSWDASTPWDAGILWS